MGVRAPEQVCVFSSVADNYRGQLGGSEREGKALWLWASWQRANLGGVVLGVGGSSSWISAPGHSTALLHLVFLHQQWLWQ